MTVMPRFSVAGIDFPENPAVGDVFMGWTWDGTKWIRTPVVLPPQMMVAIGTVPPSNPEPGFLWWDDVGGNLYIWYSDPTSSQWVIANVGVMGPTGPQGVPGPAVPTVNIQPSVDTAADLPTTGNNINDARITVDTGDLWIWDGAIWFNAGQIQGPPGPTGATGAQGPAGPPFSPSTTGTGNIYVLQTGPTTIGLSDSATITAASGFLTAGNIQTATLGTTSDVSVGTFLQTNGNEGGYFAAGLLTNNGNMLVGWSASGNDAKLILGQPLATWQLGSSGSDGSFYIWQGGSTGEVRLTIDTSGNLTWVGGTFQTSGPAGGGNINVSGNVQIGNALNINGNIQPINNGTADCGLVSSAWSNVYSYNYPAPSDARIKKGTAAPPAGALSAVLACPTVQFHWNVQGQDQTRLHRGFLTADVEKHVGADFVVKDPAGKGPDCLLINELIAVLWQGMQELNAELQALKAAK